LKTERHLDEERLFLQYSFTVDWPPVLEKELISLGQAEARRDYKTLVETYMELLAKPEVQRADNANELKGYIYFSLAEASCANPQGKDLLSCVSYLNLAWNCEAKEIQEAAAKLLVAIYESEDRKEIAGLWRRQLGGSQGIHK
jgi:hypothetical protein